MKMISKQRNINKRNLQTKGIEKHNQITNQKKIQRGRKSIKATIIKWKNIPLIKIIKNLSENTQLYSLIQHEKVNRGERGKFDYIGEPK